MKKICLFLNVFILGFTILQAQSSYLTPFTDYKVNDTINGQSFSAFDVRDTLLYGNDGDTIRCYNLKTGNLIEKFGKPAGYSSYPSFITISPEGDEIWAGFTVFGNTDDRIYCINIETGIWDLKAVFPGNFDLEFHTDSILVSGLNSTSSSDPNSIFILDTTGNNDHRKIIEIGAYASGFAEDSDKNIYIGTSDYVNPNALYRWNYSDINAVISDISSSHLTTADADKLSDLPAGSYDCEIDTGNNLLFNFNSSLKVIAKWNGTEGNGENFDTIATASDPYDWLTMIKSVGNTVGSESGNFVFAHSFGKPICMIHRDNPISKSYEIKNLSAWDNADDSLINLKKFFSDPDDEPYFSIAVNSMPSVASISVNQNILTVDFLSQGQTNIVIEASSGQYTVKDTFVIGVQPVITGNYEITTFDDLTLEPESYWNGSDESGNYTSGNIVFPNDYNPDFFSWSGWAYSNKSDIETPGYANQYSVFTGIGFHPEESSEKNYGLAYVPSDWVTFEQIPVNIFFADDASHHLNGFFITNSTYAALAMINGDFPSKKFGGTSGNDPDWFKLSIWGYFEGSETDTLEYYLADYRFEDNTKDYVIQTWQWVDLSTLGEVDSLKFEMSSSDIGTYGINTPTYFCTDNFYVAPHSSEIEKNIAAADLTVFPNPSTDKIKINIGLHSKADISIYDITGREVYTEKDYQGNFIHINNFKNGTYLLKIKENESSSFKKFIKI